MNKSFSVALKYSIYVTAALIAYFLIVKLVDLHENPWLRIFNGVIMASGIYYAIKYFKLKLGDNFTYVDGFKTGLLTGFLATIMFTAFMTIYMFHLDTAFTEKILEDWFENYDNGRGVLVAVLIIEGFASAVVLTLTFMQLFKKSHNIPQNT